MSIKLAMNRFLGGFRIAELCRDFRSLNEASRHSYFGKFLPNTVAIKSKKKLSEHKLLCFGTKSVGEIGP
jgi:hypothetical protein